MVWVDVVCVGGGGGKTGGGKLARGWKPVGS